MDTEKSSSPFLMRILAVVVLVIAAWFLFKVVIGLVAGLATILAVVLAIVAVVWAVRTL